MAIISPVPPDVTTRMDALLQPSLTDLIDLSLLSKMGHWCMQGGPVFIEVHRFMDELVEFARDNYDTIAERVIQLGRFPDGRAATVGSRSALRQFEPAAIRSDAVPAIVVVNLLALEKRFRQRCLDSQEDLVTQNIFIGITEEMEKLSWFWQASQP